MNETQTVMEAQATPEAPTSPTLPHYFVSVARLIETNPERPPRHQLKAAHVAVLYLLWGCTRNPFADRPVVNASYSYIAAMMGTSEGYVKRLTREAQCAGAFVKGRSVKGKGTAYTLLRLPHAPEDLALNPFSPNAEEETAALVLSQLREDGMVSTPKARKTRQKRPARPRRALPGERAGFAGAMTAAERLTFFFYLLTRGTPDVRGIGWGEVNSVIDEVLAAKGEPEYTSAEGLALAEGMVRRLRDKPSLDIGAVSDSHYRCESCTQVFALEKPGAYMPKAGYFSAVRCNETGHGVVLCTSCCIFANAIGEALR